MFTEIQNMFTLSGNLAVTAVKVAFLVVFAITCWATRFSIKAIVVIIVVGAIAMAVVKNATTLQDTGTTTINEIKTGQLGTTTGMPAPRFRVLTPPAHPAALR